MKGDLTLVEWKVRDIVNQKLFRSGSGANEFVADLKKAYITLGLDWDCKIAQKDISIEGG